MTNGIHFILFCFFAYLCGSIPFGKIVGRRYGIDIQKRGSGNIGFANVLRVLGWKAAIPVLLFDISKGFLPTFLAFMIFDTSVAFCVGFIAVIGHLVPVWLRFRGGKGVATSLGVLLAITPLIGIIGFSVYVVATSIIKRSSTASFIAGLSVLVAGVFIYPHFWWAYTVLLLIAAFTLRHNFTGRVPNYDIA